MTVEIKTVADWMGHLLYLPEYPGEWPQSAIAWHEHGQWVPCPSCGASLIWHEAGYVPGYRLCTRPAGGHHVQLAADGRSGKVVRR
jgi:hypothetical protein